MYYDICNVKSYKTMKQDKYVFFNLHTHKLECHKKQTRKKKRFFFFGFKWAGAFRSDISTSTAQWFLFEIIFSCCCCCCICLCIYMHKYSIFKWKKTSFSSLLYSIYPIAFRFIRFVRLYRLILLFFNFLRF